VKQAPKQRPAPKMFREERREARRRPVIIADRVGVLEISSYQ
jgi:hypothetical protein